MVVNSVCLFVMLCGMICSVLCCGLVFVLM